MSLVDAMSGGSDPFCTVQWDWELDRIASLPRRPPDFDADWTDYFRLPGSTARLRPIQSRALHEIAYVGSLLGPIGVGHGKELIMLLAPTVAKARRPVFLVPSGLVAGVRDDHARWSREFRMLPLGDVEAPRDGHIHVVAYEWVSSEDGEREEILERIRPDLIVANEAHKLARFTAARTTRFFRYLREHPGTRYVAVSGSFVRKSVAEIAPQAEAALRRFSPAPSRWRSYQTLKHWSEALGTIGGAPKPGEVRRHPGALVDALCDADEKARIARGELEPLEAARRAYRRRMAETPGVVMTEEGSLAGCELVVRAATAELPAVLAEAMGTLERRWVLGPPGDEDEISEAARAWAAMRQLAQGFYYRRAWPGGVRDEEWLRALSDWNRELREQRTFRARPGMDSVKLLTRAAERGEWRSLAFPAWAAVRDRPYPPTVAVWIDDQFLARFTAPYVAPGSPPTLIWYEHRAVGEKLAAILGLPLCGEGDAGGALLKRCVAEQRSCLVSIGAHREGKNLQAVSHNLVLCPPSAGDKWEQLLGRTHRPGQLAQVVRCDVLQHVETYRDALKQAISDARMLEQSMGRQKLCSASLIGV